jgi:polyhydroxyalkanoate synthesis repressor PhaR
MTDSGAGAQASVVIKKYSNRRLYDTRQSRYITLEELAQIIQAGATVQVQDAKDGIDLTRQVLTQAILERQERLDLIPIELLHLLIRVQGTLQQVPFANFLASLAAQFRQGGALWAQQFSGLFPGLTGLGQAPASPPATAAPARPHKPSRGKARKQERAGQKSGAEIEELMDLRTRMDALLKKLGKKI